MKRKETGIEPTSRDSDTRNDTPARRPLKISLGILVALVVSGMCLTGLNLSEYRTNKSLNLSLTQAQVELKQKKAKIEAEKALIASEAQDFCTRANASTEDTIESIVDEYHGLNSDVESAATSICQGTIQFLASWYSNDSAVQQAFQAGQCEQDAWGYGATLSASITNPLSYAINVTVEGSASSQGVTLGVGRDYLSGISPGETRVVNVYVSTNRYTLDECTVTKVSWWPAG